MTHLENPKKEIVLERPGYHCEIHVIDLIDFTDRHDNPVQTRMFMRDRTEFRVEGKLFKLVSPVNQRSLVIVIEAPDYAVPSIMLDRDQVHIDALGFPVDYEYCNCGEEEHILRQYFASVSPAHRFSLVNNWGESNQGKDLCEEFVFGEIDRAAELGIDAVQLDDGWQIGDTATSRIPDANGQLTQFRNFDDPFWEVNRTKFPNGLEAVTAYAREKHVAMGLWFAPDSRDHFAHAQRDLAFLRHAYEIGFRYFKLDMVIVYDRDDYEQFSRFLEQASKIGNDISLQLDVTFCQRLGFLSGYGFGKLFVENRYVKSAIYYPFKTLKNLWELSQYMPAQRFQFEIPNPDRYTQDYRSDDVLAPVHYSADWQLASVFVSNPLFWMELHNYTDKRRDEIKPLLKLWSQLKEDISTCEVVPVGERPNGCSLTGFDCKLDAFHGYLILLSEVSPSLDMTLSFDGRISTEILAADGSHRIQCVDNTLHVQFEKQRAYVILSYSLAR